MQLPVQVPVLEIGGTHVTAGLVSEGRLRHSARLPIDSDALDPVALTGWIVAAARELSIPAGSRWGVALPGPFDYLSGIGRYVTGEKFGALGGVDLGAVLRRELASAEVTFVNDADAFALGEASMRSARRCVGITLGTGVGSGWVQDLVLVEDGPSVPPEGSAHLVHVHGRPLEDFFSRRAIRRGYAEAGGDPEIDVIEICGRARGDDARALHTLQIAVTVLSAALSPWFDRFDAEVVVIGGSMSRSWDVLGRWFGNPAAGWTVEVSADSELSAILGTATLVAGLTC